MNNGRNYKKVYISEKCKKRISGGHPWIYDNEITKTDALPENGEIVDVLTEKEKYVGSGLFNMNSKIRIRLISRNANDTFDDNFWKRRVKYAVDYRKTVLSEDEFRACRLIFGEADELPGLTVDRFENLLSVQILSLGIEMRKDIILNAIREYLKSLGVNIDGIYLRNDVKIRELEGMKEEKSWYFRNNEISPKTIITENNIKYNVDIENGQKTGFFLDQKRNRRAASSICEGMNVLDLCTHTGSFALNCAKSGASHVTAVDVSESAIEMAKENAVLNNLSDKIDFVVCDVFDYLKNNLISREKKFDYIILDPPAFTKSRNTLDNAKKGYLEVNTLALRNLSRGGYFATCSCSHFMTEKLFFDMLCEASAKANVTLKQIEFRTQCADHPIMLNVPETNYLKFFMFQVV